MSASDTLGTNLSNPKHLSVENLLGDIESICHLNTNEKKAL